MGFFEQFPYANFQQFNLDWILQVLKRMEGALDDSFQSYITDWVAQNYNKLFFDAAYDPTNDTLTMALAESLASRAGGEPVSYINLAGQVLEILDKAAREQIDALKNSTAERIENIETDVSAHDQDIADLTLSAVDISSVVIFGDSYVKGSGVAESDRFANRFQSLAHPNKCQVFGYAGLGFSHVAGGVYDAQGYFDSIKTSIDSPEDVTCVIVCLGWNDKDRTDVRSKAVSFFNNLKTFFPNARIVYMPTPSLSPLRRDVYYGAVEAAWGANCMCLNSGFWLLFDLDNFQNDYVHPASFGHKKIAMYLYQSLCGIAVPIQARTVLIDSIGTSFTMVYSGETVNVYISFNKSSDSTEETVGNWPEWMFKGNNSNKPRSNFYGPTFSLQAGTNALAFFYWTNTGLEIKCKSLNTLNGSGTASGAIIQSFTFNTMALFG